jgi:predicted Rossmann fold nucleotide-binding protein DprA/Smf involved in DNA uptake
MKDLDALLKAIADGLEAMAEGIHAIAKKVDDLAEDQAPEKQAKAKPAAKKKATPSRKATKKAKPQGAKPLPAPDKVLEVIKGSNGGVDNQTIIKKTGLNQKQVSSALLRLKKYGKVKSVKRGIHTAV